MTTTTPQAALLSDDETDRHLDSVLVASGSALRHFSLPYNVENMRKAMHAHEAAILAKLQATQEPVQAGELPERFGRVQIPTATMEQAYQHHWRLGYEEAKRAALAAHKPLTRRQINEASRDAQISFCLKSGGTYEEELARAIERAHGIGLEVKHG